MEKSIVSLIKCESYEEEIVKEAIDNALLSIGGIEKFVKSGSKVLLKPNLLGPRKPESAVTTHPVIVKVLANILLQRGCEVIISDSPGFLHLKEKFLTVTGMKEVADELCIKCIPLEASGFKKVKLKFNKKIKEIHIAKLLKEVDIIINLPKLKTHSQTFYTGSIKNMFAAIPQKERQVAHSVGSYELLSEVIVDIFYQVKPTLNIMDGVIGMEGNGPSAGEKIKIGILAASEDAVALDAVCNYIIGYDINKIHTTKFANQMRIGNANFDRIDIEGVDLDEVKVKNFKKPYPFIIKLGTHPILGLLQELAKVKPYIDEDKCKLCKICSEVCPVGAIQYERQPFIDEKKCIECFCCQELCPEGAVIIKRNTIAKLLSSGQ